MGWQEFPQNMFIFSFRNLKSCIDSPSMHDGTYKVLFFVQYLWKLSYFSNEVELLLYSKIIKQCFCSVDQPVNVLIYWLFKLDFWSECQRMSFLFLTPGNLLSLTLY